MDVIKIRLWYLLFVVFFITSCAGSSRYMRPAQTLLNPTEDKALVRFMRPSGFGFAINFNMLDGERVIGNSVARSQFDYITEPGRHLFVAIAENKAFVEAELEAGKTYYILTQVKMGVWKARVGLVPVNKGSKFWDKVKEYEHILVKLDPDKELLRRWEEANKSKIKNVLSIYETILKNKKQVLKLNTEDGR